MLLREDMSVYTDRIDVICLEQQGRLCHTVAVKLPLLSILYMYVYLYI